MENKFVSMNWQFKISLHSQLCLVFLFVVDFYFIFFCTNEGPCIKNVTGIFIGLHSFRQNCCIPFFCFPMMITPFSNALYLCLSFVICRQFVRDLFDEFKSKQIHNVESVLDERNQKKCSAFVVSTRKFHILILHCAVVQNIFFLWNYFAF